MSSYYPRSYDTPVFATRYEPHEPRRFAFIPVGESMTQQQFVAECDVNNILAKYRKTGMVSHLAKHQGNFGDFTNVTDYRDAMDKVIRAQDSFSMLPSELRTRFQNDPAQLISFLEDSGNDDEAVKLGLKVRPPKETSMQESMENALAANDAKRDKKSSKKD